MPRAKPDIEGKIADAALKLAATQGWQNLTLDHIAKAAKIPPAQVHKTFADKNLILAALVRQIDARAAAKSGKPDQRATPHDRLFEAMMARFDVLQAERKGILAILAACRSDPSLMRFIVPAQQKCMQALLARLRLAPHGMHRPLAALGLLGIYYRALWIWQNDSSPDMAGTMAALDRGLRCGGRLAEIVFRDK